MEKLCAGVTASHGLGEEAEPAVETAASPETTATCPEQEHRVRALVLGHFDFVWRVLRRLGVPESDVDDAAQQVFVVAAKRMTSIAPGCERTFVFGTALRTAATMRRSLQRRHKWMETRPADAASSDESPHEALERRQALALLDDVLSGLSDELREVFVLCELEELSAPEVAALQGIPVGTVASRLRRARKEFGLGLQRIRTQRLKELP